MAIVQIFDGYGKIKQFKDIPIPRIGERIEWDFTPSPTVKDVVHLPDRNLIIITIG